jgi:hypothetical protein
LNILSDTRLQLAADRALHLHAPVDPALRQPDCRSRVSEYELIKYPQRGVCLFRCGGERFNLRVIAPDYKARLFGNDGGV